MRNQAQTRQIEVFGTNAIAFSIGFTVEDANNEPPVLVFTPPGPFTNAVGTTNAFVVSATDADLDPVILGAGTLPFTATFNPGTGAFAWWVTNLYSAGTTNIVNFTADDGVHVVTNSVVIVVPWDANGNGMPDDWEYRWFQGNMNQTAEGDFDGDDFPNYAEWVASTDPAAPGSYIGWEAMFKTGTNLTLTFQAVPGRSYHIEARPEMAVGAPEWSLLGSVTNDGDTTVTWTDTTYNTNSPRYYRIKVPAFTP
jgi:hypothetical protein